MIYPLKNTRLKLHFLTGVHVKHVTFDNENLATGITYALNPCFTSQRDMRYPLAYGSPGILERWGISAEDALERVRVKKRVDLPGVGINY
ncbi:hypothetical protein BJY52DRAFT_1189557 [Lactarius psammicola]|nr:hypothetical protein BJY52DRAFT_1189557 [Lactarius psammicola]